MSAESIDHEAAGDFFARACDLGEIGGCTSQVELITQDLIEGAVKDSHTAFKTACLKRNSAAACTALAMELMRGVDLPRDPARARALLHRACIDADSSPKACYELGRSYSKGEGGDRDRTTGAKYFRYACDQGHMRACEDRGDLLNAGRGILRDDHDALAMYTRACEAGVAMACHKGAVILDEGTYVTADPAQATEMYQAACDYGSGEGCTGLGLMLEQGASPEEPNPIGAREAFERGIALGSISALREQARMLWNGVGGSKQRVRARRLASEACQKGDARACRGAEAL